MALRLPLVDGYKLNHNFVDVPGGRAFHVAQTGDGPPVVLLHGWPQHWWAWRHVIPKLAERHRVIALDLRGFGWSDIAWEGFDKETMANDVIDVMDARELERVSVIGHDWGGWIGYLLALRHPDRVDRLITLNSPPPFHRPTPGNVAGLIRRHQLMMASPLAPRRLRRRRYLNHTLRRWGRKSKNLPGPVRRRYWLDTRASTRARAGMLLHREWVTKELPAVLAGRYRSQRLETPTLALYGESDPITPSRLFKGHERHADDLRIEGVPEAGHLLPEERPELVAERALEFFG